MEDVVGDAIRALRIGEARSARAHLYGAWGLRWDPSRGAGLNIHVVLAGSAWLRPDGQEPTRLRTGDVVFVSRGIAHGVSDSPSTPLRDVPVDEREYWFDSGPDPTAPPEAPLTVLIGGSYALAREGIHPLLEALPPVIVLPRSDRDASLDRIIELLVAEHDRERPGATAAIPALLDLLLASVIRAWFESADPRSGWAAAVRDRAMAKAVSNMQNHPEVRWTVESLARASNLSRATFARRFTELIGQPPLHYLTRWRVDLAKQLLAETDLPLSAVARRVGYSSEFAFGKAFAREEGIAPGAHRRALSDRRPVIARRSEPLGP